MGDDVDIESRQRAAELTEEFRDGIISNFDFEEAWPSYDKRDRALKAIETMLWRFYSDGHEQAMVEEGHTLNSEQGEIFNRCVLFLRTDLNINGRWTTSLLLVVWGFSGAY